MRYCLKLLGFALLFVSAFALAIHPAQAGGKQNLKIGYVNLQKALNSSLAGKRATQSLEEERESLLEQIREKEEELKAMQEELSRQVSVLTEESLKEKQEQFRKKMKEYERFRTDSVQEWERKKNEWREKLVAELIKVVQELGKEKQYTMIFAREPGIIYASDAADLTDEVIAKYNSQQQ